jgi:hypothetical protein
MNIHHPTNEEKLNSSWNRRNSNLNLNSWRQLFQVEVPKLKKQQMELKPKE